MWKQGKITILVAGTGKKCASLLETLQGVPGLCLGGILDPGCDPSSLALARELGVPLARSLEEFPGPGNMDVLINTSRDPALSDRFQALKGGLGLVLDGMGARLVRLLAVSLRKAGRYEGRFRAASREIDAMRVLDRNIVGRSPLILEMQDLISQVAPTPTSVLFLGETGTGKDLAARSIHAQSLLRHKPFVSINCTALTPSLMESELFGYRKGAFTGAESDRKGLLEEADGGTVFLDEIGDMELQLQAKLLRFLQTGEVRRVGSTQTRHVKVRVIAATNRDLEQAVRKETFRSDLFYRFNTFTIHVPPLRSRREDIPYLAYHFVTKAEAKLNRRVKAVSPEALAMMTAYDWPGNVRELENVIERAAILCRGEEIRPRDLALSPPITPVTCAAAQGSGEEPPCPGTGAALLDGAGAGYQNRREMIMDNFEKKELERYLEMAQGNVSKASRLSGIPRRSFYRKMNRHGL